MCSIAICSIEAYLFSALLFVVVVLLYAIYYLVRYAISWIDYTL
jgi:hypothetical protein